jgi:hypothetical protein
MLEDQLTKEQTESIEAAMAKPAVKIKIRELPSREEKMIVFIDGDRVALNRSQVEDINVEFNRCNQEAEDVDNETFIHGHIGDCIEVLISGDTYHVFDREPGLNPIIVDNYNIADHLLYWEVCKQSNHPVYWIDYNRPDNTVWYGTVNEMSELLGEGYFPNLFHGYIYPDGQTANVIVNKQDETWQVKRWSDKNIPPPPIFELNNG